MKTLPAIHPIRALGETPGYDLGSVFAMGQATNSLRTQEVYRQYSRRVASWIVHLSGPGLDLEEVLQEVFAIVHERLPGLRGPEALPNWIYLITLNVVRHHRRLQGWRRFLRGSADEVAGTLPTAELGPLQRLEGARAGRQIQAILDRMKERYREVLVLFEIEGLSGEQIAEIKGVPLETVWTWLRRARADFVRRYTAQRQREGGEGAQ